MIEGGVGGIAGNCTASLDAPIAVVVGAADADALALCDKFQRPKVKANCFVAESGNGLGMPLCNAKVVVLASCVYTFTIANWLWAGKVVLSTLDCGLGPAYSELVIQVPDPIGFSSLVLEKWEQFQTYNSLHLPQFLGSFGRLDALCFALRSM